MITGHSSSVGQYQWCLLPAGSLPHPPVTGPDQGQAASSGLYLYLDMVQQNLSPSNRLSFGQHFIEPATKLRWPSVLVCVFVPPMAKGNNMPIT